MKRKRKHVSTLTGYGRGRLGTRLVVLVVIAVAIAFPFLAMAGGEQEQETQEAESNPNPSVDREYVLEAFLDGYVGLEGEIEGQTNPVLTARAGETVRITIVNGESMPHDIVMEQHGASSEVVNSRGSESSVTFTAETDDYYFCSVGSHRQAGMEGEFRIE